MEMTRVIRPALMSETGIVDSESANDKTMALDEGMEMRAKPKKRVQR